MAVSGRGGKWIHRQPVEDFGARRGFPKIVAALSGGRPEWQQAGAIILTRCQVMIASRIFSSRCDLSVLSSSPRTPPTTDGGFPAILAPGEVAEWLNAPHSKCGIGASLSGVRIPPSPPARSTREKIQQNQAFLGTSILDGVAPECSTARRQSCHHSACQGS